MIEKSSTQYQFYVLEAIPPEKPGNRHTSREKIIASAPTLNSIMEIRNEYLKRISPTDFPEVEGIARIDKGVRKILSNMRRIYFHGPLGWMESAWVGGNLRHPNNCFKCETIWERLRCLYPNHHPKEAIKKFDSRRQWEQLEELGADQPHVGIWALKHGSL